MGKFEERAGFLLALITSILFCGAAFGVAQTQINHNKQAINTYAADHDILLQVQSDVRWMRARMARDDRLGLSPRFGPVPGNNPPKGTE